MIKVFAAASLPGSSIRGNPRTGAGENPGEGASLLNPGVPPASRPVRPGNGKGE